MIASHKKVSLEMDDSVKKGMDDIVVLNLQAMMLSTMFPLRTGAIFC